MIKTFDTSDEVASLNRMVCFDQMMTLQHWTVR